VAEELEDLWIDQVVEESLGAVANPPQRSRRMIAGRAPTYFGVWLPERRTLARGPVPSQRRAGVSQRRPRGPDIKEIAPVPSLCSRREQRIGQAPSVTSSGRSLLSGKHAMLVGVIEASTSLWQAA